MAAIRPVNMQIMLQMAPEVNRATNNDGSRAETQQNQFAQAFQRVRNSEQTQVVQPHQTDEGNLDPDGSAGKEKQQKGKRRQGGKEEEEKKPQGSTNRGMLDIMM